MSKKVILILGAVVVVAAAGLFILNPKGDETAAPTWITAAVTSGSIVQSITATGTIEPVTSVDVGTQVSGIVTNLYVDYNSVVKRGQIIAELDKSTLKLELSSNRNNLTAAQASLELQEAIYNRTKALHESGLASDSEYESDLYNYTKAQTDYATAKNNVARSEINLGYATIYSPIDGVVLSREVEEGQTVASSYSTPTLFNIAADLTDMRVIADIDEADIGNVKEGQRVSFTVDAFPGEIFSGAVTQVRQQATVTSNVVTYEVVISAANPDLKLKPGLTASVEVFTVDVTCDTIVPAAALNLTPEFEAPETTEGQEIVADAPRPKRFSPDAKVVWVKGEQGHIRPIEVSVGMTNGISTEVSSNELTQRDSVIIGSETPIVLGRPGASGAAKSPFLQSRPGPRR
ncbi:MAG: efflux RND transporter periplasmic adaptor subunit [Rikenellaceae bacterium]